jgi:membrane protein
MAESGSKESLGKRVARLVSRVQSARPVRVYLHYIQLRGPLLGSGLAYSAIFAVFAGLWIGFSLAGIVISGNVGLQEALLQFIDASIPGLIAVDGGSGAIDPDALLDATIFGLSGIFAGVVLLVTALNWLNSARDAVRILLGVPPITANFVLLRLGDLGLAVAFGAVLLVSAALSVIGTQATGVLLESVGIDDQSVVGTVVGRSVSLTVMFVLDALLLAGVYRVLSHVRVPLRRLRTASLLAAAGTGGLKVLASASLIGAGGTNPLVSSFAVIFGLLVFLNLVCQVIVIGAAWVAIEVQDHGIVLDEEAG